MYLVIFVMALLVYNVGTDPPSRLDDFYKGHYQKDEHHYARHERGYTLGACRSDKIGGSDTYKSGMCLPKCDGIDILQVNYRYQRSPSLTCDVVKNNCGLKCCIEKADAEELARENYPCIADEDKDYCYCHHGGECKASCDEHTERHIAIDGLCSINCVCCKKKIEAAQPMEKPSFTTFDLFNYTFGGGECTYILFKECVKHPTFLVAVRYMGYLDDSGVYHTQVSDVLFKIKPYLIQLGLHLEVYVNGKRVTESLPWSDDERIVIKKRDDKHVKVILVNKFKLVWNGNGNLVTGTDNSLHGYICGLLGNADGNPYNDLIMEIPGGGWKITKDINEFANSWMIPGSCKNVATKEEADFVHNHENWIPH